MVFLFASFHRQKQILVSILLIQTGGLAQCRILFGGTKTKEQPRMLPLCDFSNCAWTAGISKTPPTNSMGVQFFLEAA